MTGAEALRSIPPFLFIGLLFLLFSFVFWVHLQAKRLIEVLPRAKVRSVPMGAAELRGRLFPRSGLRGPLSGRDCVWYRFERYERRPGAPAGDPRALVRRDETFELCWLDDGSGRLLIDTREFLGALESQVRTRREPEGPAGPLEEEVCLPAGTAAYVLGVVGTAGDFAPLRAEVLRSAVGERETDRMVPAESDDALRRAREALSLLEKGADAGERMIGRGTGIPVFVVRCGGEEDARSVQVRGLWASAAILAVLALILVAAVSGLLLGLR